MSTLLKTAQREKRIGTIKYISKVMEFNAWYNSQLDLHSPGALLGSKEAKEASAKVMDGIMMHITEQKKREKEHKFLQTQLTRTRK